MTATTEKTIKAKVFVMIEANFGSSAYGNQGKWFFLKDDCLGEGQTVEAVKSGPCQNQPARDG